VVLLFKILFRLTFWYIWSLS